MGTCRAAECPSLLCKDVALEALLQLQGGTPERLPPREKDRLRGNGQVVTPSRRDPRKNMWKHFARSIQARVSSAIPTGHPCPGALRNQRRRYLFAP